MTLEDLKNKGAVSVMYHYVRDNAAENTPLLNSLSFNDFKSQLDWLQNEFKILEYADFQSRLINHQPFPNSTYALTFDDGLKDHYKYVFPELRKRGLYGFFYINSSVYEKQFPLAVHITHFVLDKIGVESFTQMVMQKLHKMKIEIPSDNLDDLYRADNANYAKVKTLMNHTLDYEVRDKIIEEIFYDVFTDAKDFCNKVYLTVEELREMHEGGMVIGNHTHSHKVMSRLSRQEQLDELQKCNDFLLQNLQITNPSFCYPYGHHNTFNGITLELLNNLGFSSAYTTKRENTCPTTYGKFMLQRYDTIELLKFHPNEKGRS